MSPAARLTDYLVLGTVCCLRVKRPEIYFPPPQVLRYHLSWPQYLLRIATRFSKDDKSQTPITRAFETGVVSPTMQFLEHHLRPTLVASELKPSVIGEHRRVSTFVIAFGTVDERI